MDDQVGAIADLNSIVLSKKFVQFSDHALKYMTKAQANRDKRRGKHHQVRGRPCAPYVQGENLQAGEGLMTLLECGEGSPVPQRNAQRPFKR